MDKVHEIREKRCATVVEELKKLYPDAVCSLDYTEPLHLLIATRLAAQCTDARVNTVTPVLFSKYPTLEALSEASVEDIEEIIKSCGLYKTKARDISALCKMIRYDLGGVMPDTLEGLLKLPGIGRKTANLMMGDVYGQPAVVADTHCIRISNRLGLCDSKDPHKVELQLRAICDPNESNNLCHRFVMFGRDICTARNPKCSECPIANLCEVPKSAK